MHSESVNVVTPLSALDCENLVFRTVPTRENHVLNFIYPLSIALNNLRNRIIELNIISEESMKRRHGTDKKKPPKLSQQKERRERKISNLDF
jgi:hypothetical protein